VRAASLDHALGVLESEPEAPRLLAGGTDLMVEIASGKSRPGLVLDLWSVGALRGVRAEEGGLRLGALTTCAELRSSALVGTQAPLLARAAREVGAVQIQQRATLGGNLGTASPAADLNPVLFALGARVRLASRRGLRELAVEDFVTGYRATALAQGELIESVLIPHRDPSARQAFRKVGTRRAQSIAKIVVALELVVDGGRIVRARAAAGSVAERTLRLAALERVLGGAPPEPERLRAAARAAARDDARPQDDVRSTASYRREVLARVLTTLLLELCP
jgi:carbon-monoxide dehydrogenase small subunit/xanthine dehydrogenase small subunit